MSHYGAFWSDRFDSSKPGAAIVHRNTVYLDRAAQHLRTQGADVPADLLPHVAPLGWEHIALAGDYVWTGTDGTKFRRLVARFS